MPIVSKNTILSFKSQTSIFRKVDDIDMLEGGHRGIVELLLKRYAGINTKVKQIYIISYKKNIVG